MNALILYESVYGNTEQIAQAVATVLAPTFSVGLARADELSRIEAAGVDLLIVGGPTHRQRISAALEAVLEATPRGALKGVQVAAFDTRYRMAAWLAGSAARRIARRLCQLGGSLLVPAESFFMERDVPPEGTKRRHEIERLEPGELQRAAEWAQKVEAAATAA
jgi:flavodoxin